MKISDQTKRLRLGALAVLVCVGIAWAPVGAQDFWEYFEPDPAEQSKQKPQAKPDAKSEEASVKIQCPQERNTPKAPDEIYHMKNPVPQTQKNILIGKNLYLEKAQSLQCKHCHGVHGDGTGELGLFANPLPRNFTCWEMMKEIPDGQMFWVIKKGVPNTAMPSYDNLSDEDIWKLVMYVRKFSRFSK